MTMTAVAPQEWAGAVEEDIEVPLEDLEARICELAGHLDAAKGRFLVMLGSFDAREGWAGQGTLSCAHWLAWRCSFGLQAAREHVRVAKALRGLSVGRRRRAGQART